MPNPLDETQQINANDVIVISDSGKMYWLQTTEENGGHEPTAIAPLDDVFKTVPTELRGQGVTLAIMPESATQGGCTCYLLNLESLKSAGSARAKADPNLVAAAKIHQFLGTGGKVIMVDAHGKTQEIQGQRVTPKS